MRLDRALIAGFALAFTPGFNVANVGAVADTASRQYGVGLGVIGLFTTALFLSHAVMQVPMGRLCDRLGARTVGVAGLVVVAGASAAALTWEQPWFAIAMRFVAGFGTAASFVGGSDYMRAMIGTPVAQGLFGAVSMAGGGLAVGLLPLWASWRTPFIAAASVAAVGAVIVLLSPRDGARATPTAKRATVRDRRLLPLGAWHAASFGLSVVLGNWTVTLLHRAGGVSEATAGIAGGLILFLGVISRPAGGRLIEQPMLVRASFVAAALGTAALDRRDAVRARRRRRSRRRARGRDPVRAVVRRRRARPPGRAGCRGRLREHDRGSDDPRRHAAARAHVLAPGERAHRLRRRRGAVSRDRLRAAYAPSSSVSSAFWTCSRFSASSQIADRLP